MKKIWILLAIALVVLFVGFREGLEPTATIKAPPYSPADTLALYDRLPQSIRNAYVQETGVNATEARTRGGTFIGLTNEMVYRMLYTSATAPLTETAIRSLIFDGPGPGPASRNLAFEAAKLYFIQSAPAPGAATTSPPPPGSATTSPAPAPGPTTSTYQSVLTAMGQSTGPAPTPTGRSVLARKRPGIGDNRLRSEVSAYTGLPRDNPMVNTIINEMGRFYDRVYVPSGKRMPTQAEIHTFVARSTAVPRDRKPSLKSSIDYWFTEPAIGSDFRLEGAPSTPPQVPGTTVGGGSPAARGFSKGIANNQIWGPPFSGFGRLRGSGSDDGDGSSRYPTLMGPPRERAPYMVGVGVLPPGPSSIPGDKDLIPDPYRVSQSYSPASNSSKNEPVPFLTDFSAFLK